MAVSGCGRDRGSGGGLEVGLWMDSIVGFEQKSNCSMSGLDAFSWSLSSFLSWTRKETEFEIEHVEDGRYDQGTIFNAQRVHHNKIRKRRNGQKKCDQGCSFVVFTGVH